MRWWENIFNRDRSAQDWDAHRPEDETVEELKALFEAAHEDAPEPDEKLWEKLRPQLAAHEAQSNGAFSFTAALAATGPRFAVAALGVLLLVASLFWSRGVERQMSVSRPQPNLVVSYDRNPLNPTMLISNALEAQTGMELLQYAVHAGPER